MTNKNYYTPTSNYTDHSTFGGYVNNGDFFTEYPQKKGEYAERIISDWKFDQQCKRNAENRDRSKQFKQQKGVI